MATIWIMQDESKKTLLLLTPEELESLPQGTVLLNIFGDRLILGRDYIDNDTRFGHLAYGVEIQIES